MWKLLGIHQIYIRIRPDLASQNPGQNQKLWIRRTPKKYKKNYKDLASR